MKRKYFETENSIGHYEGNFNEEEEPNGSGSGGKLYPPGVKIEGEEEQTFFPKREYVGKDSGGPLYPTGVKIEEK